MTSDAVLAAVVDDDEIQLLPISLSVEDRADPASSPRMMQVPEDKSELADRYVVVIADGPTTHLSIGLPGNGLHVGPESCVGGSLAAGVNRRLE